VLSAVLEGKPGPALRVVLANAAAALLAAERVGTPRQGVALAEEAVASGRARQVLERLVVCSRNGSG
jgi:anthranilate phosphoribosyltransferase